MTARPAQTVPRAELRTELRSDTGGDQTRDQTRDQPRPPLIGRQPSDMPAQKSTRPDRITETAGIAEPTAHRRSGEVERTADRPGRAAGEGGRSRQHPSERGRLESRRAGTRRLRSLHYSSRSEGPATTVVAKGPLCTSSAPRHPDTAAMAV